MVERILTEKQPGESDIRAAGVLLEDGARLSAGATPVEAARYASAAAACSVERLGAAPSMPTAQEVAARLARA